MIRWKTERKDTNRSKRGVEPFKRKKNITKKKKIKKKLNFGRLLPLKKSIVYMSKFISN